MAFVIITNYCTFLRLLKKSQYFVSPNVMFIVKQY